MCTTNTAYDLMDKAGFQRWIWQQTENDARKLERLRRNLRRAMREELTPRQQEILELYYFQDRSVTDIAQALHVNKSTVSRSVRRSCGRLQKFLQYSL